MSGLILWTGVDYPRFALNPFHVNSVRPSLLYRWGNLPSASMKIAPFFIGGRLIATNKGKGLGLTYSIAKRVNGELEDRGYDTSQVLAHN